MPLHQPTLMLAPCLASPTTDYARLEIAISSTGDHIDLCKLRRPPTTHAWRSLFHRPAIMLTLYNFGDHRLHTYGERRFVDWRSCWPLHNFDDHRLRTHGDRRFLDRRSCWPYGDRLFIDRRSCWPCVTSATTDYSYGERRFINRRSWHPSPFICNF